LNSGQESQQVIRHSRADGNPVVFKIGFSFYGELAAASRPCDRSICTSMYKTFCSNAPNDYDHPHGYKQNITQHKCCETMIYLVV